MTGPLNEVDCTPEDDGRWQLVMVRELKHPRELVWTVLTEPDHLREWAPYTSDRSLATPGAATLTTVDSDEPETLPATVSRAEPPALLEYTWGDDLLRWELAPIDGGTRLTLHHSIEDRTWVPRVAAGWHVCLYAVEGLLDGQPIGPAVGDDAKKHGWDELHERYATTLGIPVTD